MKFRISVTYTGYSFEEILQIDADNSREAEEKCKQIKEENRQMIERCNKHGIFVSKQIKECKLCNITIKESLRKCEEIFDELENNV